ncbi:MAG: tRNA uridine(34) 5-carboxymethylaminomethyl modification radical SAM/GNAT enzyme Elp3 [Chloroflexi bacterium]|nr:tRNA uridine(34) 5-carboxymethylaminomethyl modification radical SAM/GNAT enzyme Elp3 [Chloroflexota bacterium]
MRKISRTISGVTPVAVMGQPIGCPGQCIYCPTFADAPKSYTPESPAVLRAKSCNYEPRRQVEERIRILTDMGHPADKVELIVMGGTFLAYPKTYQYQFIKDCYDALNGSQSPSLDVAKQMNETANHRCVGLCIETRPDWCQEQEVKSMLEFGATRVELGVQTLDDHIYQLVKRGHTIAEVVRATKLLKDYGFKVYYHWMPGLPEATPNHDLKLTQQLFDDESFRPDGLKLYPTLVIAGTELETWYRDNRYQPYSMDEMVDLMINIKTSIPNYTRIPRVMRDIPSKFIVAGCKDLALRGSLKKRMEEIGVRCNCVRCREYGHRLRDGWRIGKPHLKRLDYEASGGKEVFLSFEDEGETLFGLLRMRIGSSAVGNEELVMVRELHVFGSEVPLGEQRVGTAQHRGLGNELLKEAERIARDEFQARKIAIISGVGAREYFRSEFCYKLDSAYMVKELV